MTKSVFRQGESGDIKQPMLLGDSVNVARYDQMRHPVFDKLTDKQLGFFWRPEEVDISKDRIDFNTKLSDAEKHIFVSNLQYQVLLDSVQGRGPSEAFGTIASLSELENWIKTWEFSETIHSRSYTHIIRNLFNEPSAIFDAIENNEEIKKRAVDVSKYYDEAIRAAQMYSLFGEQPVIVGGQKHQVTEREVKEKAFLCMNSVNALEAIRFYVSFACSFSFAERKLMEGNSKIIRLIARDENLHLSSTQHILNLWSKGKDDPEMADIAEKLKPQCKQIFMDAVEQEKAWADYLFSKGSVMGMNAQILKDYIDYIADQRMRAIGIESGFEIKGNPIPWMNNYLNSDNVQVAPQESEISSYIVSGIDAEVDAEDFADMTI